MQLNVETERRQSARRPCTPAVRQLLFVLCVFLLCVQQRIDEPHQAKGRTSDCQLFLLGCCYCDCLWLLEFCEWVRRHRFVDCQNRSWFGLFVRDIQQRAAARSFRLATYECTYTSQSSPIAHLLLVLVLVLTLRNQCALSVIPSQTHTDTRTPLRQSTMIWTLDSFLLYFFLPPVSFLLPILKYTVTSHNRFRLWTMFMSERPNISLSLFQVQSLP